MKILIVGSGAREHALVNAIAPSPLCTKLYAAPGNPGMAAQAELVPVAVEEIDKLVAFADANEVDFVIVGPEVPLALGLVDALDKIGILAFGPTRAAAQLESSKAFTKELCRKHSIPTAAAEMFTDLAAAKDHVRRQPLPIVIKADGLAAGKGVTIARDLVEADAAIEAALSGAPLGEAGARLVIEQFLDGEEISFFALVDGTRAIPFGAAQDHKAAFDGDIGPNTGGMGAYSPVPMLTHVLETEIMDTIVRPTVAAMAASGTPFRGILFAGLILVGGRPYLIEYNARFGDPECEVLLPRLDCDLLPLLLAAAGGNLGTLKPVWRNEAAIAVMVASNGYPGAYKTGSRIDNVACAELISSVRVLHAGTALDAKGELVSNGGRVLAVTCVAPTMEDARGWAYLAIDALDWKDGFCRRDIGNRQGKL